MKYIPKEYLPKLKEYAYKCIDASPTSKYIMQPYWTFCVRFLPLWMAPNLVTLLGFAVQLSSYLLFCLYAPTFSVSAPSFVYFYAFFALEFYSLLDNLDGKQARRTGTSSPLGELFDHGCDCIATVLICLPVLCTVHVEGDFAMGLFIMSIMAFWLATWEEYHTGVLFLGYFNGPTEGVQILSAIFLSSSIFGDGIWENEVGECVGFALPAIISTMKISTLVASSVALPTIFTLYFNYKSVADHAKANNKSPIAPLRELLFFFFITFLILTSYLQSPHLWNDHPHVFYMFFGLCFGELTHRLILAHVTKQKYALGQRPMWPLLLSTANTSFKLFSLQPPVDELTLNIILLVVQIILFGHYFLGIVDEITTFLNIKCLSIPYKKD